MIQAAPQTPALGLEKKPRLTSGDRFRQAVTESTSQRSMASFTNGLATRIREARRLPNDRKSLRLEQIEQGLEEQWRRGRFSVTTQLDYEQLFADIYNGRNGNPDWKDLRSALLCESDVYKKSSVQESLVQVMTSDQFANLLTTTIRFGVIERCELAPMTLLSLVRRNLRLTTGTTKLPKFRSTADVVEDCEPEMGETEFFAIPSPNLITLPEACKKKFAVGYTREMLGTDPNGFLRDEIERMGESMDLHIEKLLADLMFGLYAVGTAGANPFPYIEDGIMWDTYLAAGAGGPWANDITSNPLDGTYLPFETVELLIEKQRDPYSGEPVVCNRDPKILVTNRTSAHLAMDGLGGYRFAQDVSLGTNGRYEIDGNAASRFDVGPEDIVYSAHIFDRLKAWFQTAAGGSLNAAQADTAAHGAWLYGDPGRAFGFGTEWDRERLTRAGTDTWQYFNQEVIFAAKWMEKTTPVCLDPMVIYRNRA